MTKNHFKFSLIILFYWLTTKLNFLIHSSYSANEEAYKYTWDLTPIISITKTLFKLNYYFFTVLNFDPIIGIKSFVFVSYFV